MGLSQVPHPAAEGRGAEIVQPGRAIGLLGVWREREGLGAPSRVADRVFVFRDEAVRGDEFAPVDGSNRQFRDGVVDRAIPAAGHEVVPTSAGRRDGHEQRDPDRVRVRVSKRQGAESAAEKVGGRGGCVGRVAVHPGGLSDMDGVVPTVLRRSGFTEAGSLSESKEARAGLGAFAGRDAPRGVGEEIQPGTPSRMVASVPCQSSRMPWFG